MSKQEFEARVEELKSEALHVCARRAAEWVQRLVAAINRIDCEAVARQYLDDTEWSLTGIDDGDLCKAVDDAARTAIDETDLD